MKQTPKFQHSKKLLGIIDTTLWRRVFRVLREVKNIRVVIKAPVYPKFEIPPVRELRYDLGPAYAYLKQSNSKDAWQVLGRAEQVEGAR